MARRRALSQDIIIDEQYNALSLESQNIYVRMLAISDDCGVVPATPYTLNKLLNTPPQLCERITELLQEIVQHGLGSIINHAGRQFFVFKPSAFSHHQAHFLNKRTKSEYLRIPVTMFQRLVSVNQLDDRQLDLLPSSDDSDGFQEIPGNSSGSGDAKAESRQQNVDGRKQKADSEPVPASLDDVVQLFADRGYIGGRQQAEKFWNHYNAIGWVQGKSRAPIRDWRAAAANWNSNNKEWGTGGTAVGRPAGAPRQVKMHTCTCGWTGPESDQYRHLDTCPRVDRTGAGVAALMTAVDQLANRMTMPDGGGNKK